MKEELSHSQIIDMVKNADYKRFANLHPLFLYYMKSYWIYRAVLLYRIEHNTKDISPRELNAVFLMRSKNKLAKQKLGVQKGFLPKLHSCYKTALIRSRRLRKVQQLTYNKNYSLERHKEQMFWERIALINLGAKA